MVICIKNMKTFSIVSFDILATILTYMMVYVDIAEKKMIKQQNLLTVHPETAPRDIGNK